MTHWILLLPLELFLVSSLGMFLYMLPGLLDPENLIDRRHLLNFVMYSLAFLIMCLTCSFINDKETI